jgi:hypothetical protein
MADDMMPEPPPLARRVKPRQRTLLRGIIIYADGIHTIDCTIRDLSEDGARLVLKSQQTIPSRFHLINFRSHTLHEAELVRVKGVEMGVRLLSTLDLRAASDPALAQFKRIYTARLAV